MNKIAIILTGTVAPSVTGGCFSPVERFDMYTATLDFYARIIGKSYPIIFLENSKADLSGWKTRYKNSLDLSILQFRPDSDEYIGFDNSRGKGFNEYLMIKKGISKIANYPPINKLHIS